MNLLQQDKQAPAGLRPATTSSIGQYTSQPPIGHIRVASTPPVQAQTPIGHTRVASTPPVQAPPTVHTRVASTPPVQVPSRVGASALAATQQTQAMPAAMKNSGGNNGGRRHWPVELWVVRHGETIENNTRVIAGQNASGLTANGQEQANLLAQRLQDVKFAGIYISDLNRTKQTADAVLRAMEPGTPAFTDSRLREKGAGQYEGYKIGYIEQMTRVSGQAHRVFRPPGGESWEDVARRSRSFMREVLARYCTNNDSQGRPSSNRGNDTTGRTAPVSNASASPDEPKRILIVTHGGFISEFLSSAVGGVPNCAKNCSYFVLACARDHPQARAQFFLKTINEVAHLAPLLAKGVEQSGPETVTENDTNAKDIEEEDDEDKSQKSSSSTVHNVEVPTLLSTSPKPLSGSPQSAFVAHDDITVPGEADGMTKSVDNLSLNGSHPQPGTNGQKGSPISHGSGRPSGSTPSIHARNSMQHSPAPKRILDPAAEHVQC